MENEKIIIRVDFDEKTLNKSMTAIEQSAKKTSENTGKILEESINRKVEESKEGFSILNSLIKETGSTLSRIAVLFAATPPIGKGLFGSLSKLSFASGGLFLLSEALEKVDNSFLKFIGNVSLFSSVAFGKLTGLISFAIVKVSSFAIELGTNLSKSLVEIAKQSNYLSSQLQILTSFVGNFNKVTNDSSGTADGWKNKIEEIATSFNLTRSSLIKSSQEIISIGSRVELTSEQMEKLLLVSAEYAKINGKDVFDTTLAMVNALNGNAQAVQALGIKLTQTSLQQYAYKKGIDKTIDSLSEKEIVQLRYNKLLSQYSDIAGIAAVQSATMADQDNRLAVILEKLKTSFGKGVGVIENFNIVSSGLSGILQNVPDKIIEISGVLSALIARFIQITGYVVSFSFKIFILAKLVGLLNIATNNYSNVLNVLSFKIPLVNKSFADLFGVISGGKVKTEDLANTFVLFNNKVSAFAKNGLGLLTGKLGGAISIFSSVKAVFTTFIGFIGKMIVSNISLIKIISIFAAKFIAMTLVMIGVIKIFKTLEERTNVFTDLFNIMVMTVSNGISIFDPFIELIKNGFIKVMDLANLTLGLMVDKLAKFISFILSLVASNPFNVFSEKTIEAINKVKNNLDNFSDQLSDVGYDIRNFSDTTTRSIASVNAADFNIENLVNLKNELKNVGKSQLKILEETRDSRLKILSDGLKAGVLLEKDYQDLTKKVLIDFEEQKKAIKQTALQKDLENKAKELEQLKSSIEEKNRTELENLTFHENEKLSKLQEFRNIGLINEQGYQQLQTMLVSQGALERSKIIYKAAWDAVDALNDALANNAVRIVQASMEQIGKSLAGAGDSFKAFLGIVVNILGDMAISMGTTIIAASEAIEALKATFTGPIGTGAGAIVLGGALIAVGAAMKASASQWGGGGGSSISSRGSGSNGGIASNGGYATPTTGNVIDNVQNEDKLKATQVQLIVNGDVLDSNETGTRIVKLLNDAFENRGTVLSNARFA